MSEDGQNDQPAKNPYPDGSLESRLYSDLGLGSTGAEDQIQTVANILRQSNPDPNFDWGSAIQQAKSYQQGKFGNWSTTESPIDVALKVTQFTPQTTDDKSVRDFQGTAQGHSLEQAQADKWNAQQQDDGDDFLSIALPIAAAAFGQPWLATAFAGAGMSAAVAATMAGAVIGGGVSAITGGDVLKGAVLGGAGGYASNAFGAGVDAATSEEMATGQGMQNALDGAAGDVAGTTAASGDFINAGDVAGTSTNGRQFLQMADAGTGPVTDSPVFDTTAGGGLIDSAPASGTGDWNSMTKVSDFGQGGVATGGGSVAEQSGFFGQAADWAAKHQTLAGGLASGVMSVVGGIGAAALRSSDVDKSIQANKDALSQKTAEAAQQAEDQRLAIQNGSYFDSKLPFKPNGKPLRRPDGTLVYSGGLINS